MAAMFATPVKDLRKYWVPVAVVVQLSPTVTVVQALSEKATVVQSPLASAVYFQESSLLMGE